MVIVIVILILIVIVMVMVVVMVTGTTSSICMPCYAMPDVNSRTPASVLHTRE